MRFRPCIDIHNGKVKQIVGGSLRDEGDEAKENFVAARDADEFAKIYRNRGIKGGHVILLNPATSEFYEETKRQALLALSAYPGGLSVGGGMNLSNGREFLDGGAYALIFTSFLFSEGRLDMDRVRQVKEVYGREHVIFDLSCRRLEDKWYVVTDRWQTFTDVVLTRDKMEELSEYCCEFLIHGVDVEGKSSGMDEGLVRLLSEFQGCPVTYAGGIGSLRDLERFRQVSGGRIDVTIGSAMDTFGGHISLDEVLLCTDR